MLLKKFSAVLEGKASFTGRQQGKERLRALAQTASRTLQRRRQQVISLKRGFHIAGKFVEAQIADRDAEVAARHIFQLVSFVKNNSPYLAQNAGIGCVL